MKRILNYSVYSRLAGLDSSIINEGISFKCSHMEGIDSPEMIIDWNLDSNDDVVKLANPRKTVPSELNSVRTYAGYALENIKLEGEPSKHSIKKCFSEYSKNWGSISSEDLKNLIDYTYPQDLKNKNVKLLFVMGSSAPLAANIAESLKELYYKDAKIIDIMKAYYGIDPNDIIDWDKYEKADPRTRSMIDSFLNRFKSTTSNTGETVPPMEPFTGYIKKSSGLQSGARSILKSGHMIDDYIISSISSEMREWIQNTKGLDFRIKQASMPHFLTIDDLIIEGSTMRGALTNVLSAMSSADANIEMLEVAKRNMLGYVLFTYGSRFR